MRANTKMILVSVALLLTSLSIQAQKLDSPQINNTTTIPKIAVKLGANTNSPRMELLNQYILASNVWNRQNFETFHKNGQSYFIDANIRPFSKYNRLTLSVQYEYMTQINEGRVSKEGFNPDNGSRFTYSYNQMMRPTFNSISIIPFMPINISRQNKVSLTLGAGISYNSGSLVVDMTDYQNVQEGVYYQEKSNRWSNTSIGAIYLMRVEAHLINRTSLFVTGGYRNANIKNIKSDTGETLKIPNTEKNVNLDFSGFFGGVGISYHLF